ncbi:flagellar biosynthesis protein FlhA, partial [Klebsiella pneumoniae]|nr:flagellar biosynthesis protein FlhA [Klebsiella pneumoniae]
PNLAQNIEMQAMSAVQHQEAMGAPTVLLVNHSLRLILSRFLRRSLPQLAVMSNLELNDRRQIRMTSMIGG